MASTASVTVQPITTPPRTRRSFDRCVPGVRDQFGLRVVEAGGVGAGLERSIMPTGSSASRRTKVRALVDEHNISYVVAHARVTATVSNETPRSLDAGKDVQYPYRIADNENRGWLPVETASTRIRSTAPSRGL